MNGPAHLAHVAALRQLAGRELPIHKRLADVAQAADALATATRSWPALEPRGDAVERAALQADALARALRELRADLHLAAHRNP